MVSDAHRKPSPLVQWFRNIGRALITVAKSLRVTMWSWLRTYDPQRKTFTEHFEYPELFVPLAPHCTCSELGLTASLHVAASVPFFLIHEGYLDGHIMPPGVARKQWDLGPDGYATLPQGIGLGVEMDEQRMAHVAAEPHRRFQWPHPTYEDGSVRDY